MLLTAEHLGFGAPRLTASRGSPSCYAGSSGLRAYVGKTHMLSDCDGHFIIVHSCMCTCLKENVSLCDKQHCIERVNPHRGRVEICGQRGALYGF